MTGTDLAPSDTDFELQRYKDMLLVANSQRNAALNDLEAIHAEAAAWWRKLQEREATIKALQEQLQQRDDEIEGLRAELASLSTRTGSECITLQ
jgi:chromosome segregation ATPase